MPLGTVREAHDSAGWEAACWFPSYKKSPRCNSWACYSELSRCRTEEAQSTVQNMPGEMSVWIWLLHMVNVILEPPKAALNRAGQGSDTRPCPSPSEGHGTLSSLNHSTRGSWHQLRAPSPVSLWHSPKMSLGGQTGDWRRHSHISGPPKILIRGR